MSSITIVIPSYNESKRLPVYLQQLCKIASQRRDTEIVVSDDGSRLEEYEVILKIVEALKLVNPALKLHIYRSEQNVGKGAAIAREFRRSNSDIVGFVDADGSVSASECFRLLDTYLILLSQETEQRCSSVIGSRLKILGNPVTRLWHRHYIGRVFATLVSELFDIPVYDSQCGCKFYVRNDLLKVIDLAHDGRWLWDTQILISLVKSGYRVVEIPVSWHDIPGSKVSMIKDAFRMFTGMIRFRLFIDDAIQKKAA